VKLKLRKIIPPIDCISLRALARAAGCDHSTVQAAVKRGELDVIKIDGERETWVRDSDAAVWIAERPTRAAALRKRPRKTK
jgi:hypothetical protein